MVLYFFTIFIDNLLQVQCHDSLISKYLLSSQSLFQATRKEIKLNLLGLNGSLIFQSLRKQQKDVSTLFREISSFTFDIYMTFGLNLKLHLRHVKITRVEGIESCRFGNLSVDVTDKYEPDLKQFGIWVAVLFEIFLRHYLIYGAFFNEFWLLLSTLKGMNLAQMRLEFSWNVACIWLWRRHFYPLRMLLRLALKMLSLLMLFYPLLSFSPRKPWINCSLFLQEYQMTS